MAAVADIFRHIEQDRSRAAGGRDRKGATGQFGDAARLLDADQFLDGGFEDLGLTAFLRHVLPGMGAVCVAGDRDNRDAAVQRLDKAGHEVGRAGAQGAVADAGAVRNSGIGIGRKGATALVIDQEMPQAEAGERVVERQELKAAHAEHRPGA